MTTLELLDEAIAHQNAARDLLRLLSGAENLGTPAPEILSGALSGIEYLLDEAQARYEEAREKQRTIAG